MTLREMDLFTRYRTSRSKAATMAPVNGSLMRSGFTIESRADSVYSRNGDHSDPNLYFPLVDLSLPLVKISHDALREIIEFLVRQLIKVSNIQVTQNSGVLT